MSQVFGSIEEITLTGYAIRTCLVGLIMFTVARFIAKRAISELTTYDFVFAWILGALTVAPVLDGKISFTYTVVPICTLYFWHTVLSLGSKYNQTVSDFFNGKPLIIINQGQIVKENLKKHFINAEILLAELRLKDIANIADVDYAILEPNGQLSILMKPAAQPVTAKALNLNPASSIATLIIHDGILLEKNLAKCGVDRTWLDDALKQQGITSYRNVYLATLDSQKQLFISLN